MHTLPSNLSQRAIDFFWSNVDILDSANCWIWRGSSTLDGRGNSYGFVSLGGYRYLARRISYLLAKGEPEGQVKALCGNSLCVNPEHLVDRTTTISRYN